MRQKTGNHLGTGGETGRSPPARRFNPGSGPGAQKGLDQPRQVRRCSPPRGSRRPGARCQWIHRPKAAKSSASSVISVMGSRRRRRSPRRRGPGPGGTRRSASQEARERRAGAVARGAWGGTGQLRQLPRSQSGPRVAGVLVDRAVEEPGPAPAGSPPSRCRGGRRSPTRRPGRARAAAGRRRPRPRPG